MIQIVGAGITVNAVLLRLLELQRLHSDIELRLHASDCSVDLEREGIDLVVRYGDGSLPGLRLRGAAPARA